MLLVCILVLVSLGTWAVYVAMKQDKTIAGFAEPAAVALDIPAPSPEALERAGEIEASFRKAVEENAAVKVELTAEDLNTLIATREMLKDFRGNTRVESISGDGLSVAMSQPMRSGFMGDSRFLNGTLLMKPELRTHTVFFVVTDIRVPGKEVPRGFIDQFSSLQLYRLDVSHPVLGPGLQRLETVEIVGDRLVVTTRALEPGEEKAVKGTKTSP